MPTSGSRPLRATCDYQYMNTFFCTTIEPWPESGVSWRRELHLTAFSLRSDALIEESIAACQRGLKELAAACESVYMNTFFSTTIERWRIERSISCERNALTSLWAGVGRSWSGNLHLQVFLPRSESFSEDSFAECQRRPQPIGLACDYDGMNTFFSTTIERWRIGRFIPCERNASPVLLRAHRVGPVWGTVATVFFSQARVTRWEGTIARTAASRKGNSDAARQRHSMNTFLSTTYRTLAGRKGDPLPATKSEPQ